MTGHFDITLMDYADGRLDAQAAAAVERDLAANPQMLRRLLAFARAARLVRCAYDPAVVHPLPESLVAQLSSQARPVPAPAASACWPIAAGLLAGFGLALALASLHDGSCRARAVTDPADWHTSPTTLPVTINHTPGGPGEKQPRP